MQYKAATPGECEPLKHIADYLSRNDSNKSTRHNYVIAVQLYKNE